MSQREALRALQARLAERLQSAATSDAHTAGWLAVECAGLGLLLPLAGAGEIFKLSTLLPVPHTQPWFLGVANLRGRLHGVADLAAFLGLRAPLPRGEPLPDAARVLALNPAHGGHIALLVDRLAGLRSAGQFVALPDTDETRPAFAGPRWHDAQGREWQELDLSALAAHPHFLGIAA
jgi:twitching motility protein PilI